MHQLYPEQGNRLKLLRQKGKKKMGWKGWEDEINKQETSKIERKLDLTKNKSQVSKHDN